MSLYDQFIFEAIQPPRFAFGDRVSVRNHIATEGVVGEVYQDPFIGYFYAIHDSEGRYLTVVYEFDLEEYHAAQSFG